jgi:hypothetical protein
LSRRFAVDRGQLFDPQLGCAQALDACSVELLAAPEERDRVVHRDVAALEPRDDVLQLLLELLERALAPLAGVGSRRAKPGSAGA